MWSSWGRNGVSLWLLGSSWQAWLSVAGIAGIAGRYGEVIAGSILQSRVMAGSRSSQIVIESSVGDDSAVIAGIAAAMACHCQVFERPGCTFRSQKVNMCILPRRGRGTERLRTGSMSFEGIAERTD
jgi:hypothetical protein